MTLIDKSCIIQNQIEGTKEIMKKKTLSVLLAMTIMAELAACGKKNEDIPYMYNDVLETFADNTNLDELMESVKPITVGSEEESEEISFSEAVSQLEERLQLSKELSVEVSESSNEITDTLKEQFSNLSYDEIKVLLDSLKNDNLKDIEKERINTGLSWIVAKNEEWIKTNGLNIAEALLKNIIKASACEVSGLELEYYDNCTISAEPHKHNSNKNVYINLTDPVSEKTIGYHIDLTDNNVLTSATLKLYNLQRQENPSYDTIKSFCQSALDFTKLVAAAGVELTDENEMRAEISSEEAEKLITEKMKTK